MIQSILVLTHHKAASTFLRRMLTSSLTVRYKVLDYAGDYWKRPAEERRWQSVYEMLNEEPEAYFTDTGHIYGPLRDTIDIDLDRFRRVIVARDPAETLVSEYVSFGFTHPLPPEAGGARKAFLARREAIRAMSVDAYADKAMERLHVRMCELAQAQDASALILPYAQIVRQPAEAIARFLDFANIATPSWMVHRIIRVRQSHSSGRMHKSRKQDFKEYRLSDEKRAEISAEFADVAGVLGL